MHAAAHRRVVLFNEHFTSQRCPRCKLVGSAPRDKMVANARDRTLKCMNADCGMVCNRDDVGSENIFNGFSHYAEHGCRPEYLDGRLVGVMMGKHMRCCVSCCRVKTRCCGLFSLRRTEKNPQVPALGDPKPAAGATAPPLRVRCQACSDEGTSAVSL